MTKHFFALIGTSSNACGGVKWAATGYNSTADIIGFAQAECNRQGSNLESLVGIEFVGVNPDNDGEFSEYKPSRDFAEGEELRAALEKLNDDGRTFKIYDDSDPTAVLEFLEDAESVGLSERASELTGKFS